MMNDRKLGRSGLKVSELCLGTMQWGWTTDEATAWQVMDAFVEAGGTFIDTADIYSSWAKDNPGGVSEEVIGRWMAARGNRDDIVLATKVRGRMWPGPNGEGLSRAHILRACDDSLRRLQTDSIDLYQTHWPDDDTPIEETLDALTSLVQQGKVRYLGCSNYSSWQLTEAIWCAEQNGFARFDSIQPHYNLVHRGEFEREQAAVCARYGVGIIPYSPLAAGFLTGKYRKNADTASERAKGVRNRYFNERGWKALDALLAVAGEVNKPPTAVALAWLLAQPGMTAPIIGANSVAQLADSLAAVDLKLTPEQLRRLSSAAPWEYDSGDEDDD
jgi:aryl-alcohol dehydrogenase-like predicted oxidoreductase